MNSFFYPSTTLMKHVFPDREIPYNLRNLNPFQSTNLSTVFNGTETVAFRGPKIRAVPEDIPNSVSLIGSLRPKKYSVLSGRPGGQKRFDPGGCKKPFLHTNGNPNEKRK